MSEFKLEQTEPNFVNQIMNLTRSEVGLERLLDVLNVSYMRPHPWASVEDGVEMIEAYMNDLEEAEQKIKRVVSMLCERAEAAKSDEVANLLWEASEAIESLK